MLEILLFSHLYLHCAVLCCAVLCCAVLRCVVPCCADVSAPYQHHAMLRRVLAMPCKCFPARCRRQW